MKRLRSSWLARGWQEGGQIAVNHKLGVAGCLRKTPSEQSLLPVGRQFAPPGYGRIPAPPAPPLISERPRIEVYQLLLSICRIPVTDKYHRIVEAAQQRATAAQHAEALAPDRAYIHYLQVGNRMKHQIERRVGKD